jgi:hypothetical protein
MIPICKAKRIDNGEWVEGYVVNTPMNNCVIILEETVLFEDYEHPCLRINNGDWFQVHPSTVCLWTGKTDMNGVKIFEGDRVKVKIGLDDEEYTVFWHVEKCQFMLADNENVFAEFDDIPAEICEVIGSIHKQEGER